MNIMNNYFEKYCKYKKKFLNLKKQQLKGSGYAFVPIKNRINKTRSILDTITFDEIKDIIDGTLNFQEINDDEINLGNNIYDIDINGNLEKYDSGYIENFLTNINLKTDLIPPQFNKIIYHGKCPDGLLSKYFIIDKYNIANNNSYGIPPSGIIDSVNFDNMNVIIVDVIPGNIEQIVKESNFVLLIDHHDYDLFDVIIKRIEETYQNKFVFIHSNEYSASQLLLIYMNALDGYFYNIYGTLSQYIGEKDVWNYSSPNSLYIGTAIEFLISRLFELLHPRQSEEVIFNIFESFLPENYNRIVLHYIKLGKRIMWEYNKKMDENIRDVIIRNFYIEGLTYKVIYINCDCYKIRSNFGHILAKMGININSSIAFATIQYYSPPNIRGERTQNLALRGIAGHSPNLAIIAEKYGGGGHKLASNIRLDGEKEKIIFGNDFTQ